MRLFWKLFCSMVVITTAACSLGGYFLIDSWFRSSLAREITAVCEENDVLRYTVQRELGEGGRVLAAQAVGKTVDRVTISTGRGTLAFRVSDGAGKRVGGSGELPVDPAFLDMPENQRGYRAEEIDGRTYLHAVSPLALEGERLYLENCREITAIFTTRAQQYQRYFYLMLGLVAAVALASMGVSALILRPLRRLSAAATRMAAGDLSQRVAAASSDELGRLSADFNAMATRIEEHVQELQDAAQRQEDFIASFTHETKTPLTSIIGYADLLRSRPASADQVRESAGFIFREGRRLEALSRKLMDLIVLNRQAFTLHEVRADAFLKRAAGAMRPAMEQAGVKLAVRAEPATVFLEPDLMEAALLNLMDNARKAMDGGGRIAVTGERRGEGYRICVVDNGKGIPAEELGRITEAFYMVDKSRARAQGGSGLGLAICQRIVELHGGELSIESVAGVGTRAAIWLKGGGEL